MKLTLSHIKADIGGYARHSASHPEVLAKANECLAKAKQAGLLIDYHVTKCGDDLQLILTHQQGEESPGIHKLAWDTFLEGTEIAKKLKLYGAGQDLLSDAFSGNVKGMGPGVAEMEFDERTSEPILIFMADMMRRHGPFEPHRLSLEEMEYTTMPQVVSKLENRFVDLG